MEESWYEEGPFTEEKGKIPVADLVGRHRYQLDDKGRIPLPARFRDAFAAGGRLTLGYDGCIWAFPLEAYERRADEIRSHPISDRGARDLSRMFFGNAEEMSMDKQGRMPVPASLRTRLGIGREVVVVGVHDRLEIWDGAEWDRLDEETSPSYIAGTLSPEGRQA